MTGDTTPTESHANDRTTDDEPDPAVLAALADAATPLATADPDEPLEDLAPLGDALADASIVALGEATHGTREFFELKARLIRYCVERLGTRTIGLEANAGECLAIDEYVVHGDGNPRDALDGIHFWTWNVESVLDLLEWLREFNADRPPEDRVRFQGFDAQYTQGSVDRLLAFFERVDPEFGARIAPDLETVGDGGTPTHRNDAVDEQLAAAAGVLPRVRERLDDSWSAYVESAGQRACALAERHLNTVERALDYQETVTDEDEDLVGSNTGVTDEMLRIRETAMADGIDWLLDRTGDDDDGPLVCWAHDAHVAAADQVAGGASTTAMGGRLAERHGDDYLAVGFTFGRGEVRAIGEVPADDGEGADYELGTWSFDGPVPGSLDAALDATGHDLAALDCAAATADDRLAEWLATERPHHSVGATFDEEAPEEYTKPYAPGEAFDWLVHVAETTPSRPVED